MVELAWRRPDEVRHASPIEWPGCGEAKRAVSTGPRFWTSDAAADFGQQRDAEAAGDHLDERRQARRAHRERFDGAAASAHRERLIAKAVSVVEQQDGLVAEIAVGE